jgi:ABC-type transporter Mla maintaining outer membrane lipid asymmetry ATPase subunit MlaF
MPDTEVPVVQLRAVTKDYHGLRPLRIRELTLHPGRSLALLGLDEAMAGVLVDLITAGSRPDTGEVLVFGESTADVTDRERWLALLDRFGLISARGVLLEQMTAEQNLAIPLSLQVETMSAGLRAAVGRLADEVCIPAGRLSEKLAELPPPLKLRIRLGRALALNPQVLLAEHPNAALSADEAQTFAKLVSNIARHRSVATLTCTADRRFAHAIAEQVVTLQPATGELKATGSWLRWI